jgi:hypothetical protein
MTTVPHTGSVEAVFGTCNGGTAPITHAIRSNPGRDQDKQPSTTKTEFLTCCAASVNSPVCHRARHLTNIRLLCNIANG